jgi:phosphoglycolate phosphatase-like HAD superfamily hydrolase
VFVIFDYDGVIFNSGPAVHRAGMEFYAYLGLPEPSLAMTQSWLGPPIKDTVERIIRENKLERTDVETLSNRIFDAVNKATRDLGAAFPGSVELIQRLKDAGIPVGIATMKAHTELDELRDVLPALDLVDVVCAPEDHHGGTSKKTLVGEVVARLGISDADQGWMIGDRGSDIEAGRAHGLKTVATTWGGGSRAELEATKPTHIVDSMDELQTLLFAEH